MLRPALAILAIHSLSLTGCGTFSDRMCGPINDHVYYRGVRLDVQAVKEGGPKVLMAADIPFSAITDTVSVPFIAYQELTGPRTARSGSTSRDGEKVGQFNPDALPRAKLKE